MTAHIAGSDPTDTRGIVSLLDNDLYKFTMQQAIWKSFKDVSVSYRFQNRNPHQGLSPRGFACLQQHVANLANLRLTSEEEAALRSEKYKFLDEKYVDYLREFRFRPRDHIRLTYVEETRQFTMAILGLWHETVLYEVPLLSLVSEAYFLCEDTDWNHDGQLEQAKAKAKDLLEAGAVFADFGTRRRRDYKTQDILVQGLVWAQEEFTQARAGQGNGLKDHQGAFVGSSNVHLAIKYNIRPIGTLAHEWTMAMSGLGGSVVGADSLAIDEWLKVYSSGLGTFLTDTFGSKTFFRHLTKELASKIEGVRQDSGDPCEYFDTAATAFSGIGGVTDLSTKKLVFSNGLSVVKAKEVVKHVRAWEQRTSKRGFQIMFGIGTFFSNDFKSLSGGLSKPVNIVIKLYDVTKDGKTVNVVKLSDDKGKYHGEPGALQKALQDISYD